MQYEDLAEALQLPLGTVKTQLYRAKQQLRRMLETELRRMRVRADVEHLDTMHELNGRTVNPEQEHVLTTPMFCDEA